MQRKKLLLLSAIVLLMGTEGYGQIFKNEEYTVSENITVNTGTGHQLQTGKNEDDITKVINTGEIIVNKGTGVQLFYTSNSNGKNYFINAGTINVNGDGNKGIVVNKNGIVENSGEIIVANTGATGSGITLNDDTSNFVNKIDGEIRVSQKNTKGIYLTKGYAENQGNINISSGAMGVYMKNGEFTNNGTMIINDSGSKGVQIDGGKAINNKDIVIGNDAVGVNNKGIFINNGTIAGEAGKKGEGRGVILAGGLFINSGVISTTGNAIESTNTNNILYLQNGSKIDGKIVGNASIDVLALEGNNSNESGEYSNLNIEGYEALLVRNGDVKVNDSTISFNYNKGISDYLETAKGKLDSEIGEEISGNLTMANSKLVVNFADSLEGGEALENPVIDVGENGTLTFDGKTSFIFNSSDNRDEYNISDILGFNKEGNSVEFGKEFVADSTIIWNYNKNEDGDLIAKKQKYNDIITNSYISNFADALDKARPSFGNPEVNPNNKFFENVIVELESLKSAEDFTRGLAQVSGGLHGYTVDIAAINSRTLVNTMKNKALTRDYLTAKPVNSWYQDVIYLDNNHKLGGLMSGDYHENGILGVSEKQVFTNGKLGFVYGGSKGKAKFDGGDSGEIDTDNIYAGIYYNHDFNENFGLNTNFSLVYGHNSVNRRVRIGSLDESLKSHYPTYAIGLGTSAIYTLKDDEKNKASFYAGIDINRIMQGNINEKEELRINSSNQNDMNLMVKNSGANEFAYYSITPSAGFMVQNTGYIWNRKYLVGADLAWETELGNIKDGKRLNMQGIADQYKVGTMERENLFSTSIFGQLDITDSLALNGRYTSIFSDEYDADMVTLGITYKMDTMADNIILGPILSGLENLRPSSDRWGGTFSLMMESEEDSNRAYYSQIDSSLSSGDYASTIKLKPKFTLSLNDKQTNWSYYFEGYYMANDLWKDTKAGEAEQHATRIHGEARWNTSYSKGKYGMAFGYRNETSNKPLLSYYPEPQRVQRGVHQLRLTPGISYELGSGFTTSFKTTGIFEYNYTGLRDGQMDYTMETELALLYKGFMPRWDLKLAYYREDTWFDNDSNKITWESKQLKVIPGSKRYQLSQLRPTIIYYLGNGDKVELALRIPLGNGAWYNGIEGNKKTVESYERRYSVKYTHLVTPGFSVFGGVTFLDTKNKNTDSSNKNFGKITSSYSFRPTFGFNYSF